MLLYEYIFKFMSKARSLCFWSTRWKCL